jgi:hypothetical protein
VFLEIFFKSLALIITIVVVGKLLAGVLQRLNGKGDDGRT